MEHTHLAEQHHRHSTAFPFLNFGTQSAEKGFDVFPGDIGADRVLKDQRECALVVSLHLGSWYQKMVL